MGDQLFRIWDGSRWQEITGDVRVVEDTELSDGRADEASVTDPAVLTFQLNNRDGRYSPRNPESDLHGLIGRNTPLQYWMRSPEPSFLLPDTAGARARVASTAALNVSGDLDVRVEVALDTLPGQWGDDPPDGTDPWSDAATELMGRYATSGNARMWRLMLSSTGFPYLVWSTDGASDLSRVCDEPLPFISGHRFALRATLDVNNGDAGHTVTFYTAPSLDVLDEEWVPLGQPIVTAGTTSINTTGSADLEVGDIAAVTAAVPSAGRWFGAEVRSGIGGTAVARADFTALGVGTTAFTDSAGRSWVIEGGAEISDFYLQFHGEVAAWPARWDLSGADVWVEVEAAGILRRLGQGQKALESTLYRRITSYINVPGSGLLTYWPMELTAGTRRNRRASTPVDGARYMATSGLDWAADSSLPGSNPLPKIAEGAYLNGRIPAPDIKIAPTSWAVEFVYFMPEAPASTRSLFWVTSTGTVRTWQVLYGPPGSDDLTCRIIGTDADGVEIVNILVALGDDVLNTWVRQRLTLTQSGSTVTWELRWLKIGSTAGILDDSYTGSIGRPTAFKSPESYHADIAGVSIGHVSAWAPSTNTSTAYNFADHGFDNEAAADRLRRLAQEEQLPLSVSGGVTAAMGPQRPLTMLDLLQACADADIGLLTERPTLGLQYRPRRSRYNQWPALALDYAAGEIFPPLDPVDDDQATRNDITVSVPGGTSARAVLRTGPISIKAPPDGVGTYDEALERNLATDEQPEPMAWWLLHLGTFDGLRYPRVTLNLTNPRMRPFIPDVLHLQIGDRITIANPPPWLPPGLIDLIVEGRTQVRNAVEWLITFTCSPAGPWTVGEIAADDPADDDTPVRFDTDGSELVADVDEDDTELIVLATDGPAWTTTTGPAPTAAADDLPFDITVGGEDMTVSDIQPLVWDTFTRTVVDGWGATPSTISLAWLLSGGTAADRDVTGTQGTVVLPDTAAIRFQYLNAGLTDAEILTAVTVPALATGGSLRAGIVMRISGANYYELRTNFTTSGAVALDVVNSGSVIEAVSATGQTYTAGSKWWLRARIVDQTITGKVWADGSPERGWLIEDTVTSGTIASGLPGVTAARATGNTNASPVISFDDFRIVTPQRFAVVRSVNGIDKPHTAGADVRLSSPMVYAL